MRNRLVINWILVNLNEHETVLLFVLESFYALFRFSLLQEDSV